MDVAIIDDEELSIKDLSVKLEKYPDINIVSITTSASKGLEFINKRSPDVAFLDVEMPEMSGMAFLDELEDNNCKIVMYTSHQDYMLSSFRKDAFDYLMKPIDPEELASVIEHCEKHIAEHSKEPKAANIKTNLINEKLLLYTNTSDFQLVHIKDIGMFVYNSERRIWEIIVARPRPQHPAEAFHQPQYDTGARQTFHSGEPILYHQHQLSHRGDRQHVQLLPSFRPHQRCAHRQIVPTQVHRKVQQVVTILKNKEGLLEESGRPL
jgi:CheY-like chemotaxis protein